MQLELGLPGGGGAIPYLSGKLLGGRQRGGVMVLTEQHADIHHTEQVAESLSQGMISSQQPVSGATGLES